MFRSKEILITILIISLAANIFLGIGYYQSTQRLQAVAKELRSQEVNKKALDFLKMFVDKVLKSEGEVNFEDRLMLENAVRQLDDAGIIAQWKKFTESQSEIQAQVEVRNLLELLVNAIK